MAKNNFQIVHILNKSQKRQRSSVYAGVNNANANSMSSSDLFTIKITDFDELKDNGELILVLCFFF